MDDSLLHQLARRWTMRFGRPAADVPVGRVVKLVGRVVPDEEPRVSPLGGRTSVVYAVKGTRLEGSGRDRRVRRIADEEWSCAFWLERDGERERIRVEPEGWLRLLVDPRRIPDSPATRAHLDAFAARHGAHERAFFEGFGGGASYVERCVEVGARVAILGVPHEVGTVSDGYRESRPIYAVRPPANGRLWISTIPSHVVR